MPEWTVGTGEAGLRLDKYLAAPDRAGSRPKAAAALQRRNDARSVFEDLKIYLSRRGRRRPFVVHRIDRDTSGLVLFAKSEAAQLALKEQFKRHLPERVYQAIVYGQPSPSSGTWHDH